MLKFRKASYEPGIVDFGTGAYAYLQPDGGWGFSNAGLVTDGGEALLVDTMFDVPHTRAMLDSFAKASSAKIGTLVNTHHNGDHCYGNGCLDCEIVATMGAAEAMKHETPKGLAHFMKAAPNLGTTGEYLIHCFGDFDFDDCAVRAPDTTFTGSLSRMVGSKRVEMIEVGPAHTGGDALVHVPADKTLFTGDILFIGGHPILWAGPVGNWIAACEAIDAMDVETVVPGHGPVTDKAGVRRVKDYLVHIRDAARARYDAGMPAMEAARSIALDDYAGWGDAERIAVNTATLYREFGSKDAPSDAATLFGWMAQLWKDRS
ncbi:MAG TPA: MBL fold metallo-hydrolase [Rhizomicrobium sp.]|jgi:glyoxylase-like metal-dependent hydrolase (beta-lactamase superfamily II)|nr:MBL fold metallo-hydrolase [Rhizomicrobium sp.]